MKIQEVSQSQFNSEYAGDVHLKKVKDDYIINSSCIFSEFNIIKIGQIYLLYGIQLPGRDSNLSLIQVLTIYEYQGLNLLVIDVQTQMKHNIIIGHPSCEAECNGEIIDIEYFNKNYKKWMNQL